MGSVISWAMMCDNDRKKRQIDKVKKNIIRDGPERGSLKKTHNMNKKTYKRSKSQQYHVTR